MSFESLKKDELLAIAEEFGVEVKPTDTKATIIAGFVEDGVTWEDAVKFNDAAAQQNEVIEEEKAVERQEAIDSGPKQLIKMTRANGTYEVRGYTFKKSHPFAIVSESDAEWITENVDGFQYATPKEAAEFYG